MYINVSTIVLSLQIDPLFILICLGKTLADPSFEMEVNAIKAFLSMQAPAQAPAINPASIEINPEDYVAPRFARKIKSKV